MKKKSNYGLTCCAPLILHQFQRENKLLDLLTAVLVTVGFFLLVSIKIISDVKAFKSLNLDKQRYPVRRRYSKAD